MYYCKVPTHVDKEQLPALCDHDVRQDYEHITVGEEQVQ